MSVRSIPTTIAGAVHEHVLAYGELDVETGLFLLAPRGADTVSTVAFAGSAGVTRHRGRFALSSRAISRLFRHLTDRELVVLAQVHSHRGAAGLSRTDLDHGFSVEGFTTAVIPNYRRPPHDPRAWGWWRYDHGRWLSIAPYELDSALPATAAITFDEDGVHES